MSCHDKAALDRYNSPLTRTKGRFASYWHQIDEIEKTGCTDVLEIGPGGGFLRRELRHLLQRSVVCVDTDSELGPDVVADTGHIPVKSRSFCAVVAFQVLEHMPFTRFHPVLCELARVADTYVIVSLPDRTPFYLARLTLPLMRTHSLRWSPPFALREHLDNPSHYWEIGLRGYSVGRIVKAMEACDLRLLRTFRVDEEPYHRFFVLRAR
jgi:SAM-dependent methyltransferase